MQPNMSSWWFSATGKLADAAGKLDPLLPWIAITFGQGVNM